MNPAKRTAPANPLNHPHRTTRLLPWSGPEGNPCYLLTDGSGGHLSRIADNIESVQLGMGNELLGHARELIDDPKTGSAELRYLSARLTESLQDALRVAESRGARLPVPDDKEDDLDSGSGDGDGLAPARREARGAAPRHLGVPATAAPPESHSSMIQV